MAMLSLDDLLTRLAAEHPVFHSEADFQHALGWVLRLTHPDLSVRIEFPMRPGGSPWHVDLFASSKRASVAIELKYKTRKLAVTLQDETFALKDQAAQDLGRYDFVNDIHRLEEVAAERRNTRGYAVLLTNDSSYWRSARERATVDAAFRLWPGRTLAGTLAWDSSASAGTRQGREAEITLRNSYRVVWRDYSQVESHRYGTFKYLAIEVPKGAQ